MKRLIIFIFFIHSSLITESLNSDTSVFKRYTNDSFNHVSGDSYLIDSINQTSRIRCSLKCKIDNRCQSFIFSLVSSSCKLYSRMMKISDLSTNNILMAYGRTSKIACKQGEMLKTLKGHTNAISNLAELNNGYLASGSWDNTIRIWNLQTKSSSFK